MLSVSDYEQIDDSMKWLSGQAERDGEVAESNGSHRQHGSLQVEQVAGHYGNKAKNVLECKDDRLRTKLAEYTAHLQANNVAIRGMR